MPLAKATMAFARHSLAERHIEGEAERKNYQGYRYIRHVHPSYGDIATYL
jgi:hypothetical protein